MSLPADCANYHSNDNREANAENDQHQMYWRCVMTNAANGWRVQQWKDFDPAALLPVTVDVSDYAGVPAGVGRCHIVQF